MLLFDFDDPPPPRNCLSKNWAAANIRIPWMIERMPDWVPVSRHTIYDVAQFSVTYSTSSSSLLRLCLSVSRHSLSSTYVLGREVRLRSPSLAGRWRGRLDEAGPRSVQARGIFHCCAVLGWSHDGDARPKERPALWRGATQ